MARRYIFLGLLAAMLSLAGLNTMALGQLKFGTSVGWSPPYYLPVIAAEEKGFWKQAGLEAEWVPFRGSSVMYRAVAAGSIGIGFTDTSAAIQAASRGIPVLIVADTGAGSPFSLFVKGNSPIKRAKDLRGKTIGLGRFGGGHHAYTRYMIKQAGLEGKIKYVALGGMRARIAALKTGSADTIVTTADSVANLVATGELREVVSAADYLPREWSYLIISASREMIKNSPDKISKAVKAILLASAFINGHRTWAIDKMQAKGLSRDGAREVAKRLRYSEDGKINRKALENVRKFLIDYKIVKRGKIPETADLYTDRFTR
ncbi:MAG: ABC transporter substrate-binding protein [Thermodesulfobacteriota bacterium]